MSTMQHERLILQGVKEGSISPKLAKELLLALPRGEGKESVGGGGMDIAVIGMACRLPGACNVDEFYQNLLAGKDCVGPVPKERWDVGAIYAAEPEVRRNQDIGEGGFLENYDCFDPLFFNLSPREAEYMAPQQRLFLEESWHALEDAGLTRKNLNGINCAVFAGCDAGDYQSLLIENRVAAEPDTMMGLANSILASRIAYLLNLRGACIAVDSACSSSLVAVNLACQSLAVGESNLAIAGGAMVMATSSFYVMASKSGMLSKHGRCRTFDHEADGFVPGEGVGTVVLKRLSDAQRDGDPISGVIRGWGANQDGRSSGITAPNGPSQTALEKSVYDKVGVSPTTIGYVEAHGTGTKLGDPIEFEALVDAFDDSGSEKGYCALGAVKSSVGHSLAAAGITGLIKVLLGLRHKKIFPSLHFEKANELLDFANSPFYVPGESKDWERHRNVPLRAAISSFGFSGTNVHLLVEEAPESEPELTRTGSDGPHLILLSAKSDAALARMKEELADTVDCSRPKLADVAHTLAWGRNHFRKRWSAVVMNLDELRSALQDDARHSTQNSGRLQAMASGFQEGMDPDELQFPSKVGRRISLPGYPFERERYWIPESGYVGVPTSNVIGSLLDQNVSSYSHQRFTKSFAAGDLLFEQHRVAGDGIIPGTVMLEMARQAGEASFDEFVQGLENVIWVQTVNRPGEVRIDLFEQAGHFCFSICSESEDGEALVHCQGTYLLGDAIITAGQALESPDLGVADGTLDKAKIYQAFRDGGLDYGMDFQGIRQLTRVGEVVWADLSIEAEIEPAIKMDCCLQTVMGLTRRSGDAVSIPFSLERVLFHKTFPQNYHCRVSTVSTASKQLKFDITACDNDGVALMTFEGFGMRQLSGEGVIEDFPENTVCGFESGQAALEEVDIAGPFVGNVMVIHFDEALSENFAAQLRGHVMGRIEFVKVSTPDDLESRLNTLKEEGFEAEKTLLVAPCLTGDPEGFVASLELVHAVLKRLVTKFETSLKQCQWIVPTSAFSSAIVSMLKTLRIESPSLLLCSWTVESFDKLAQSETVLERFCRMLMRIDQAGDYIVNGRGLFAAHWSEYAVVSGDEKQTLIKDGGVYLITGGAGGIGGKLAAHLACRYQTRLVLTGRSQLDDRIKKQLETLSPDASGLLYRPCDVTSRNDVQALITEVVEHWGTLDGVIHLAGVRRDALVSVQSEDAVHDVMQAKVDGALHLHEATRHLPLDFFCLGSSVAACFGNVGQAAYAAANGFMDGFAVYRESLVKAGQASGRSVSINWPLWNAGGMFVDEATLESLHQLYGVVPLTDTVGVQMFEVALQSGRPQFSFLYGKCDSLREAFFQVEDSLVEVMPDLPKTANRDYLTGVLREVAADLLKMKMEQIDLDLELSEFGFDSISFTRFANRLNERYGLRIMPSLFFEYPNLAGLAEYFDGEYGVEAFGYQVASAPVAKPVKAPAAALGNEFERKSSPATPERAIPPLVTEEDGPEPIAVIGMSGRMPQSENLDVFWKHLMDGDDMITEIPADRWDWRDWYGNPDDDGNVSPSRWGGFIQDVDCFDSLHFGISPHEAIMMDPQQRLFMECVWHTFEHAGYNPKAMAGSETGVFAGVANADYREILERSSGEIDGYASTGNSHCILANRISYFFNFHGPSEPVDTACSSSLVALERAVEALRRGKCRQAIAGGVNVLLSPTLFVSFGQSGMLSAEGKCQTFDESADGYVRSEGVGAVLLKPLQEALSDGDEIYGVIRGCRTNHGGRANSLTAPNPNAQAALIEATCTEAKIPVETIRYVEAHGTGTTLGDPIEMRGLRMAFAELARKQNVDINTLSCAVGAVKSNVGHLETAAGMAGLFKILLSFRSGKIPGNLHLNTVNPYIDLEGSPFHFVSETEDWQRQVDSMGRPIPRRAGLSSFGFGGANAHVVIEEPPSQRDSVMVAPLSGVRRALASLCCLSARDEVQLKKLCRGYIEQLIDCADEDAQRIRIAYTTQVGRAPMSCRLVVVGDTIEAWLHGMEAYLSGEGGSYFVHLGEERDDTIHGFFEDEEGEAFCRQSLEKGNAAKIAKMWVLGLTMDWVAWYGDQCPRRLALPVHPFSRIRHWPSGAALTAPAAKSQAVVAEVPVTLPKSIVPDEETVFGWTRDLFSEALKLPVEQIDPDVAYTLLGVDSFMSVAILKKIRNQTQLNLRSTELFNYPTLRSFAAYLVKRLETDGKSLQAEVPFKVPLENSNGDFVATPAAGGDDHALLEMLKNLETGEMSLEEVNLKMELLK